MPKTIKCPKCGSESVKNVANSKGQMSWKLKNRRSKHTLIVGIFLCQNCGKKFRHAEKE